MSPSSPGLARLESIATGPQAAASNNGIWPGEFRRRAVTLPMRLVDDMAARHDVAETGRGHQGGHVALGPSHLSLSSPYLLGPADGGPICLRTRGWAAEASASCDGARRSSGADESDCQPQVAAALRLLVDRVQRAEDGDEKMEETGDAKHVRIGHRRRRLLTPAGLRRYVQARKEREMAP